MLPLQRARGHLEIRFGCPTIPHSRFCWVGNDCACLDLDDDLVTVDFDGLPLFDPLVAFDLQRTPIEQCLAGQEAA